MKKGIFYNPGSEDAGAQDEQKAVVEEASGFDLLSDEEAFAKAIPIGDPKAKEKLEEILSTETKKAPAAKEEKKDEKIEGEEKEEKASGKEGAEEKEEKEEKDEEEETPEYEFEVPEDKDGEEKESTWKDVALELGIDATEDTFSSIKDGLAKKIEAAKAEGKLEAEALDVSKFTPEAQKLLTFLNEGGSVDEFIDPLVPFKDVLALDDEGLIRKNLELLKYDKDKIEAHVTSLQDKGEVENEAYRLRKGVESQMELAKQRLYDEKIKDAKLARESDVLKDQKFNSSIKEALTKTEKFMGGKLNEKVLTPILKKLDNGEYRRRLESDPTLYAKALLFLELGDNAVKQLSVKRFEQGRETIQDVIHNTPAKKKGDASSRSEEVKQAESGGNHFDSWGKISTDKVEGVEREV